MKTKLVVLCTLALSLVAGAETAFNPLNVGGIGAVVGVTHDELNAAVESLEAKDAQLSATLGNVQQRKADKATTLSGYDIGDAYISGNTIYLGSQSLRPLLYSEGYISGNTVYLRGTSRTFLTQHQSLANYTTLAAHNTLAGRVTTAEGKLTTAEGNISSLQSADIGLGQRMTAAEQNISVLVPQTRKVNDKALTADIELGPEDVGAWDARYEVGAALALGYYGRNFPGGTPSYSLTWNTTSKRYKASWAVGEIPTTEDLAYLSDLEGCVPTTRTINGKALSSNVTLTPGDVGAVAPSAISDMETQTHAGNTYATKSAVSELEEQVGAVEDAVDELEGKIGDAVIKIEDGKPVLYVVE